MLRYLCCFSCQYQYQLKNSQLEKKKYKEEYNIDNTVEFLLPIKKGIVIKVYDGDTITIAFKLPYPESPIYRKSVRLNGIDTPEIKGKGVSDKEKVLAIRARDFLASLIMNKEIELRNISNEKYGRILADIYLDDIYINDLMVKEGYAVKYDGGTKYKPDNWSC